MPDSQAIDLRRPELVLGYAPGDGSEHVVRVGADLALRLGARLNVVHVVDIRDYPVDPDIADWEQQARRHLLLEEGHLHDLLANWEGDWTYQNGRGDPAEVLAHVAESTDALIIVVGSRGHGLGAGLQRLLAGGSIGLGLARQHHCPVMIVPPGDSSARC